MRGDRAIGARRKDGGQFLRRKPIPWRKAIRVPEEGANLVDDAGALRTPDRLAQPDLQRLLPDPVLRPHGLVATNFIVGRRLHGFGNRSASLKSFFGPCYRGGKLAGINLAILTSDAVAASGDVRPDAGCNADQERRYIGEPRFHLDTRPLLPQHRCAPPRHRGPRRGTRVLAESMPITADCGIGCLGHGVLLSLAPLAASLAGAGEEHGRTIP